MSVTQTQSAIVPAAGGRPFSWRFTTPLFVGSALNPINSSLIATALLPIAHGLGIQIGRTAALVAALYLASATAQPTAGKAAEVFGPRRVFMSGIAMVALGAVLGGLAQGLSMLILSRVVIGLGTSCAYPTAMLLIQRRARDAGLTKPPGGVLGGLMIAGIATASLGLPLGGVLVNALTWRAVFLVNVPVAVIAFVAAVAWIEPDPKRAERMSARELASRLDLPGIVGFVSGMLTLLVFLFDLPTARWWVLALSLALWALLVLWELRARTPFLDVRLLAANSGLANTYLRFGLTQLCVYVVLYGITQWIESVRGFSESAAGLLLLPMTLVSGLLIAPLSRRGLVRGPVLAAAATCLLGSVGVLALGSGSSIGVVVAVTLVFGLAIGFSTAGNQIALTEHAPADQLGTASGLLRTFGYVGSIGASAVTGLVFHHNVTDQGVHRIGWIMTAVSLALVALTLADRTLRPARHH
ncbi:MFS transporter [Streptacidiphilus jiangxiensis]|uniref:Major Facilitator Superfamily protein n=1 Tax=Streptacidiphilus jiangxiensis TaxID=235985 RepID=A0A1H7U6W4_STRJI|nr:MFS transporter [Streptacidiphilus jiangxiensis]SEL92495.1 Major Facilitator Superfamily protein [Streptacidiphilus jiangxiensis]